jgi:polysaccharide biosynthesis transport protein
MPQDSNAGTREKAPGRGGAYGGRPPYYGGYGGYGGYGAYTGYGMPYYGEQQGEPGMFGEISLRRMHRLIMRKWVAILLITGFGVAGAFFWLSKLTPLYGASCIMEMSVRKPALASRQGAVLEDAAWNPDEVFQTRLEKFKGATMTEYALALLRDELGGREFSKEEIELIVSHTSFSLVRRSMLVRANSLHPDPRMAQVIANTFAKAAQQFAFDENKTTSDNAVKWLQTQAASQRKDLEAADKKLSDFRSANNLDVMESELRTVQQTKMELASELTKIESEEVLADEILNAVKVVEAQPQNAGKLPDSTTRKADIVSAVDRWLTAVAERDILLSRYTAKHPEVKTKDEVINVYKGQVADAFARAIQTAESNVNLLKKQAASLQQEIRARSNLATDLEKQLVARRTEFSALEREKDAADTSYKGLLNRIEEARLSADENTATVKIVEPATLPVLPSWPNRMHHIIVGVLLGLLLGLGFALLTDTLEDRVMGTEDLERTIGARVLGLIPHSRFVKREELAKCAITQKFSQMTEAFAGIRGLMDSAQYRDQSHTILVTSTAPEEGKTVIATNLAATMARAGIRTLLIDFDMRRPRIGKMFAIPEDRTALINELAKGDAADFASLPFQTECENLWVIGSRATREISPSEIIGSKAVKDLIEWASAHFDRVIMDSPPYGIVSDPITLGSYANGIMLVCRPSNTRKRALRHAVRQFMEAGANVIGVLVNDIDFRAGSYFSNYDYYYGHYYSYKYRNYYGTREEKGGDKKKGGAKPPESKTPPIAQDTVESAPPAPSEKKPNT